MPNRFFVASLVLLSVASTGCVRRVIDITSDPSGATVWLNDREIGRTPCSAEITYYGTYDVRMQHPGYEPISGSAEAKAPLFDVVGIDLISEMLPARLVSRTDWHFTMTPTEQDPPSLLARAHELRSKTEALGAEAAPPPSAEKPGEQPAPDAAPATPAADPKEAAPTPPPSDTPAPGR